ncbi:MAG: Maf family protein [Bauldia sp.]|nr:Maf family protein [Bauldia sp.]
MARIILASQSPVRSALLRAAGVTFDAIPSRIDERAVEAPLIKARKSPAEIALALAEAKAIGIGKADRAAFVVGADQTLELNGERFVKPETMDEARGQLVKLSARTHVLHSGVVGVHRGSVAWRHLDSAELTMRGLSLGEIGAYLAGIGDAALLSVGAYQIEGPGIQLFERIEGDYFTILGLPMLPLLKWLRDEGALG